MTGGQPPRSTREGLVLLFFALIATIRFSTALTGWFIFDDPRALFYSTRPLTEIFFSRMYASSYYTPLLALTLRPDALIFGLNPVMYHVHNAVLVIGVSWALYLIARRRAPDMFTAVAAGFVVLLSPPVLVSVFWITLRQYLYSVLFALIAVHLHLRRVAAPRPHLIETVATLLACELSFLGKEQFMTLPAVLFLLTPGALYQRLRLTYPYFAVLVVHTVLRYHVLGGMGGGPQLTEFGLGSYLATPLTALPQTATVLFGSPLALAIVVLPWLRRWRALLVALVVWSSSLALAFLAMVSPPSTDDYRYWLQATVLFGLAIALGAAQIGNRLTRSCYLALLLVWLTIHSVTTDQALREHFQREAVLAAQLSQAMIRADLAGAVILWPATAYSHSDYLAYMARLYQRSGLVPTYPAVYPRELLVLEPRVLSNHHGVYQVLPDGLRDVPEAALREIGALHESQLTSVKPRVELSTGPVLNVRLDCPAQSSGVMVFSFRGRRFKFVDKSVIPYRRVFPTGLLVDRNVVVTLIPIEDVLFGNAGPPADDGAGWTEWSAYAVTCQYADGRSTLLSDALLVGRR